MLCSCRQEMLFFFGEHNVKHSLICNKIISREMNWHFTGVSSATEMLLFNNCWHCCVQEDQWSLWCGGQSRSRHATQGGVQGISFSGGFDQMKPSSQINVHSGKPPRSIDISKQCSAASNSDQVKRGRSFSTPWNIPMRTFPTAVSHDAASLWNQRAWMASTGIFLATWQIYRH